MRTRILVVDDNALNRKLAGDLLELEGYEVTYAEDADQALRALAGARLPDLVLMDIALPGMDGLTLTRRIRADPRTALILVVAVTAYAMKGDEQKARDAGCNGYITKPIDTRRLPGQVAHFLAQQERAATRLNVMIVEDHRLDLKLAGDRMRLSGHLTLDHTNAEHAIDKLETIRPDVVLLDLNLPGMDGLTFVRRVKDNPRTRGLPIVAITSYADDYRREELLAAGCAGYLIKPVDMEELLRQLETAAAVAR